VYLVANDYRNDDYGNYVWRSEDYGTTWTPIDGGLPAERVARTLREDPRNPDLLYLGTELGLFVSLDGGAGWTELRAGMPMMAFNDLVVHARDNDLVLGTHSRGIFILDDVNALQELTPEVRASRSHLFTAEPAYQIRYDSERGHTGDMIFTGENPPAGAILTFWLASADADVDLRILDSDGEEVARLPVSDTREGINRAVWNLRMALGTAQEARFGPSGPLVVPGSYTVRLTAGGETTEQPLTVREDPRIDVDPTTRAQWTAQLLERARLGMRATELADRAAALQERLPDGTPNDLRADVANLVRETRELRSRAARLRGAEGWVGPLAADEVSQQAFVTEMLLTLAAEADALEDRLGG
jgi:hypothetical protein